MSEPAERYRLRRHSDGAWIDYMAHEYDLIVIPVVYCECEEPYIETWKDGRVFCTRCGYIQRPSVQQSAGPNLANDG